MHTYQYIYIAMFAVLLIPKASRYGAFVFLAAFAIYVTFILPIDSANYYKLSALKDFIISLLLMRCYFLIGFLSFVTIAANTYGFMIYEYGYDPDSYDIICLIIITLQLILLTTRGLLNGNNISACKLWVVKFISRFRLVRPSNFDGL